MVHGGEWVAPLGMVDKYSGSSLNLRVCVLEDTAKVDWSAELPRTIINARFIKISSKHPWGVWIFHCCSPRWRGGLDLLNLNFYAWITYQQRITLNDLTKDALSGETFASEAERANRCHVSLIETPSGFILRASALEESRQGKYGILWLRHLCGEKSHHFYWGNLVAPDREKMVELDR